jgi:septum formation protein
LPAAFILASESEIRKKILSDAGFKFDTHKPLVDEEKLKSQNSSLAPTDLSVMLAKEKALSVSKIFPDRYVIGGDQICLFGSEIFSKPLTASKAIENLQKLSGREHLQISGLAIVINSKVVHEKYYKAVLKMRDLSLEEIQEYVEKDDPLMSSGSYKYESLGKNLFEYIKGDPYVIQGLPLEAIKNFFK